MKKLLISLTVLLGLSVFAMQAKKYTKKTPKKVTKKELKVTKKYTPKRKRMVKRRRMDEKIVPSCCRRKRCKKRCVKRCPVRCPKAKCCPPRCPVKKCVSVEKTICCPIVTCKSKTLEFPTQEVGFKLVPEKYSEPQVKTICVPVQVTTTKMIKKQVIVPQEKIRLRKVAFIKPTTVCIHAADEICEDCCKTSCKKVCRKIPENPCLSPCKARCPRPCKRRRCP